jgi:transcriptional regulator with XRE-family HTH domain
MTAIEQFGERIRELRLQLKLTQQQLADRVAARLKPDQRGFDVSYLSKIENGHLPPPSAPVIESLAAVLEAAGADADELLALAGKTPPDLGASFKKNPKAAGAFFRTARAFSEEDWERIARMLEENDEKRKQ